MILGFGRFAAAAGRAVVMFFEALGAGAAGAFNPYRATWEGGPVYRATWEGTS